MQDLANISENTGTQRGKTAEYSSSSCPRAVAHGANQALVASGMREIEDTAQDRPRTGS